MRLFRRARINGAALVFYGCALHGAVNVRIPDIVARCAPRQMGRVNAGKVAVTALVASLHPTAWRGALG